MSRVFVRLREAKGVQVNLVCVSEEAENLGKKKYLWWWFCVSWEEPKDSGQEFLLCSWINLQFLVNQPLALTHLQAMGGDIDTLHQIQSPRRGIPGSQALDWHLCTASFQGALPRQAPADRTQERSWQCDWLRLPPTSSVIKSYLPSLGFCPFSAWKCQANKGEGNNGGKKQSHVSTKCFPKPQNKQLGKTGNYIVFNLYDKQVQSS